MRSKGEDRILQSLTLMLLVMWIALFSYPQGVKFRHITLEDGLSQSSILGIAQDHRGFIWFGTMSGVNRFDGYSIKVFNVDDKDSTSISHALINALFVDRSKDFWIGTEMGLNRYNFEKENFKRYYHSAFNEQTLSSNRILMLGEDGKENIWIVTDRGIDRFHRKSEKIKRYSIEAFNGYIPFEHVPVSALCLTRVGALWVGVRGVGLYKYDYLTDRFHYFSVKTEHHHGLSSLDITALCEDSYGSLWVGTTNGLNKLDPKRRSVTSYYSQKKKNSSLSSNHISALLPDESGCLWVGTYNGGLNYFERASNSFLRYQSNPYFPGSLNGDRISTLYKGKNGELWIGTFNHGANLYCKEMQRFVHYKTIPYQKNSLNSNRIRSCYVDDVGHVWIGTDGGGVNKLDRRNNTFKHFTHNPQNTTSISNNRIFSICKENEQFLWIGTNGGGLNKFDKSTGRCLHFKHNPRDSSSLSNNHIRSVVGGDENELWIGTVGGGLNRFDKKSGRFVRYRFNTKDSLSLGHDRVFRLLRDRQGILWIGTFGGGLNKFDEKHNRFVRYQIEPQRASSINDNFILSIYESNTGDLWVGKMTGGLSKFDRNNESFVHYTTENGLPDNTIYDILEDLKGNLWLSTNKGIVRFNPHNLSVTGYDVKDGLQSNEFNTGTGFVSKDNEMFLGGINGINSFFPHMINDNIYAPTLVITDFQLYNKSVPVGPMESGRIVLERSICETDLITLSYKDKVFSFEFSALHYVFPQRNRYAFKMEGFDTEWSYVGSRRFATYTSLAPGRYVFKVKGANSDGVWNEVGTAVQITITPPFWQKWWFYSVCALGALVAIVMLYAYLLIRLKRKREERERSRVTEIFSKALSQGHAAVYRSNYRRDVYEFMSSSITDITGYDISELRPSSWSSIIVNLHNRGKLSGLSFDETLALLKEGQINYWYSDAQIKTKSGESRWIMDMATALHDENGQPYGCLGIFFDITERKLVEEQLRAKKEETEKDLFMARELQLVLLSHNALDHFPEHPSKRQQTIQFYHRYIPASALAGDFFEIIPISDQKVGVLIYDVAGHGVRASLLTAYLHGILEKLLPLSGDPKLFMEKLNMNVHTVVSQHFAGTFITAFYLVADTISGHIEFTNAGHPTPMILKRENRSIERLCKNIDSVDPPLGIFNSYNYSITEGEMVPNDVFLFYTDGLYEVMDKEGNMYGLDRLCEFIQRNVDIHPDMLLSRILNEVKNFNRDSEFNDDICMVSMHTLLK